MTVIIDYGAGNTQSVMNALDRIGTPYTLSMDQSIIAAASRLILPGVGHAAAAMSQLKARNLISTLQNYKKPFLGICLGMQLMFEYSEEGNTSCLGVIPGMVKRFEPSHNHKVPHMGWNDFSIDTEHFVLSDLNDICTAYYVHSFYAPISEYTVSTCEYILPFSAAVSYENYTGIQFHPEKSGAIGQQILANFINFSDD